MATNLPASPNGTRQLYLVVTIPTAAKWSRSVNVLPTPEAPSEPESHKPPERKVVGPREKLSFGDVVWPRRHGEYWWAKESFGRSSNGRFSANALANDSYGSPAELVDLSKLIAQTAVDRAAAADRRATTVAGSVAVAASFTLGGGSLVLDAAKWHESDSLRHAFSVVLAVTVFVFALSAVFAVRALAGREGRRWSWVTPTDMRYVLTATDPEVRLRVQAARLLNDYARNWEVADFKNRAVDNSVRCLIAGLALLTVCAALCAAAVG
ncbi:hypothetical protein [Jatrophihabitans fulvus]